MTLTLPPDSVPLPPPEAEVFTTACDYCIVGCGYRVYRWPARGGVAGGPAAEENAFGVDFPVEALDHWVAPGQHNVVLHEGRPHHVVIIPDKETNFVNPLGDSSIRGGLLAQKLYNPDGPTRDRLHTPLLRVSGVLMPVPWDLALDVAAGIGRHVVDVHGANAYGMKMYSYGYLENTYALTKFALGRLRTANFTLHDTPADVASVPGLRAAGLDDFAASYADWADAETLLLCGTDPYETKTILYTEWIMRGIERGQRAIFLLPRRTAGVAHAEKHGGLHIDLLPGTDLPVLMAIARIIIDNGWEDGEWIRDWVSERAVPPGTEAGEDAATGWPWGERWGDFRAAGAADWKAWLRAQDWAIPERAAAIADIDVGKLRMAAEWMARPRADGTRPKTSIMFEKGCYWSNNTGNTNAIASLAILCGCGGRPGRVVGRAGGHQRGMLRGGSYPADMNPEAFPDGKRALDTDRFLISGNTRLAHVVGCTWVQSMCASQSLQARFEALTVQNPHQVRSLDAADILDSLRRRADSGGMVVINQEIYRVDPLGSRYADLVLPAAGWGEEPLTRANGERRLRHYPRFSDPPGVARPDWWIIAGIARRMGFDGFDWQDSNQVLEEGAEASRGSRKDFTMLLVAAAREGRRLHDKLAEYGNDGIQGPVLMRADGSLEGTLRLQDVDRVLPELDPVQAEGINPRLTGFAGEGGKCHLLKAPWSLFASYWAWMQPRQGEIRITSGRINERWQSGYDDRRRPHIQQRWPENWIELNPADAAAEGVESGDWVQLSSDRIPVQVEPIVGYRAEDFDFQTLIDSGRIELTEAAITAVAIVTPAIRPGVGYMDFLHLAQPANALAGRVVDWISGNYNYKMGVGVLRRLGASPYKHQFRSMSFARRDIA